MTPNNSTMVILDGTSEWNDNSRVTVHWSNLNVPETHVSVPLIVEKQALKLKNEYLSWVYDFGQLRLSGKTVKEHLQVFENLSFWWMTLLGEKSPYKCPAIYSIFKLRVLEKLYKDNDCQGLMYCGSDSVLHQVLIQWSYEMGHPYQQILVDSKPGKTDSSSQSSGTQKFINMLPNIFQACLWLVQRWWVRFRHLNTNPPAQDINENRVTLVTFFPNIDKKQAENGKFYSRYWEDFHKMLDESSVSVNWVWFYFRQNEIDYREAVRLKDVCNSSEPGKYKHYLLDEFLSSSVLWLAVCMYFKMYIKGKRLLKLKKAFVFPKSKLNFYPFMKADWDSSFFGALARDEVLRMALFDSMAQKLSPGPWSMFTWENQGWELGLVSAWKRHKKTMPIFGYVHPSVRPLDLCMLSDPRTYAGKGIEAQPLPDRLAVGTSSGLDLLEQSGYPKEKLFDTEALRYMNLMGLYRSEKKDLKSSGRILLVAPGMINHETTIHFAMLAEAWRQGGLDKYDEIIFKQHPGYPLKKFLTDFELPFSYSMVDENLNTLWSRVDVVYCPNSPGVSLEAAYLGLPIIIPSPVTALNMTPLYGLSGLEFVANSEMLVKKLDNPSTLDIPEDYFFFDRNLTRWKEFLEINNV
jgi:surface carbohydrate biosynthesis protein (TIGR04326 family)